MAPVWLPDVRSNQAATGVARVRLVLAAWQLGGIGPAIRPLRAYALLMLHTREHLPVRGREYLRVSRDRKGREYSPTEQHAANVAACGPLGITLGIPYRDLGSASRYQQKRREDFDALLEDLRTGDFNAEILVLWVSSRGSRKVSEWAEMVDLLAERKIKIYVTTHDRLYDPNVRHDWRTIMDDAVRSEDEARTISENTLRGVNGNAERGEPYGRCPYGYRRIYDPRNGRLVRQEPDPIEAPFVAEIIDRLYVGDTLHAIATDFEKRGVPSRSGTRWTAQRIRIMAMNYAYIGKRVHDPKRTSSSWLTSEAQIVDATWPPIVKVDRFLTVQRIFAQRRITDTKKMIARPGRAVHLLSFQPGITCEVCGDCLRVYDRFKRYRCNTFGHVSVMKDELDNLIMKLVIAMLSRPDNFVPDVIDESELTAIRTELAEQRIEYKALSGLSVRLAAQMEPPLLSRIRDLEARERELTMPAEFDGMLRPGADIAARWLIAPLSAQRMVVRVLTQPRYLGCVRLARADSWRVPLAHRVSFACLL